MCSYVTLIHSRYTQQPTKLIETGKICGIFFNKNAEYSFNYTSKTRIQLTRLGISRRSVSSLRERFGPRLLLLLLRFPLALLPLPLLILLTLSFMLSSLSELFSELDRFIFAQFSINEKVTEKVAR